MRLFVGVPVPAEVASTLFELAAHLPPTCRLVPPENMHITLTFLGDAAEGQLTCILGELAQVSHPSFPVTLDGFGTFPGVAIAKVAHQPHLHALAAEVTQRMERCGFPPEQRPYHPHVTLARSRQRALRLQLPAFKALHFTADAFVLYRTAATPQGSHYESLRGFPLSARIATKI